MAKVSLKQKHPKDFSGYMCGRGRGLGSGLIARKARPKPGICMAGTESDMNNLKLIR